MKILKFIFKPILHFWHGVSNLIPKKPKRGECYKPINGFEFCDKSTIKFLGCGYYYAECNKCGLKVYSSVKKKVKINLQVNFISFNFAPVNY